MRPSVGSSVIRGRSVPGGEFNVFGNETATALDAFVSAGWKATINGATDAEVTGITSGNRSTGTSIAASGNGFGWVPSCSVRTDPRVNGHRDARQPW